MSGIKIGIDLGGTKMLMIATSDNKTIGKKRLNTGKDFTPSDVVQEIENFLSELNCSMPKFGIAVPGLVNESGKIISSDVLPNLNDWQPDKDLKKYGETFVLNDGNAALIEVSSQYPKARSLGVVVVGTGIGAAFMIDGKILQGEKGWAGEFGYFPVKVGKDFKTLDEIASGAAILKKLKVEAEELAILVAQNEKNALQTIKEAGANLGAALAGLINLFNLSALVLTGGALRWNGYKESVLENVKRLSIPEFFECCDFDINMEFESLVINGAIKAIK